MDKRWPVPAGITPLYTAVVIGMCRGGHLVKLSPDKTLFCEVEVECNDQVVAVAVRGADAEIISKIAPGTPVEIAGTLETRMWTGRDARPRERIVMTPQRIETLGPVQGEVEMGGYEAWRTILMPTT